MARITSDSEDSDRRELTDLIIEFAWRVDHESRGEFDP